MHGAAGVESLNAPFGAYQKEYLAGINVPWYATVPSSLYLKS
jgi:hypothetical protein